MKALVYTGPESLEYRDAPTPQAGAGEDLVKILAVGICGSDMHAYLGHDERRPAPLILGHETAGVVTGGPRDGQRVTINPLVSCGTCTYCKQGRENLCQDRQIISMPPREGAFAEWVAMPQANLVPVPDHVNLSHAALVEAIACGWHAVRLAKDALHAGTAETAATLVIGGGAIGVGAALSLKAQGILDITLVEPNPIRQQYLRDKCGLMVVSPDDVQGGDFAIVIDGVGYAQTREMASAKVAAGGVIAHIGLGSATDGLDIRRFTLQEINFIGTYTYTMQDFRDTAQALYSGALGDLAWVEERNLKDGAVAFHDIRTGATSAPKIILIPEHKEK